MAQTRTQENLGQRKESRLDAPRIGFVGTGTMGIPMVKRLLAAGYRVTVWNRTAARAMPLRASGAVVVEDVREVAASIVIVMVADGSAVHEVLFDRGLATVLETRAVVVDMSSISPGEARQHWAALADQEIGYLDAPVSGGPSGAELGSLAILVGGVVDDFAACSPVLETLGRATLVGSPGSGQVMKLANQLIIAQTIGAISEALVLARAGGVDVRLLPAALAGGSADSPVLRKLAPRMIEGDYGSSGPISLFLKDLRNIKTLAQKATLNLASFEVVLEMYEALAARGKGHLGHSALALAVEEANSAVSDESTGAAGTSS